MRYISPLGKQTFLGSLISQPRLISPSLVSSNMSRTRKGNSWQDFALVLVEQWPPLLFFQLLVTWSYLNFSGWSWNQGDLLIWSPPPCFLSSIFPKLLKKRNCSLLYKILLIPSLKNLAFTRLWSTWLKFHGGIAPVMPLYLSPSGRWSVKGRNILIQDYNFWLCNASSEYLI